MAVTALPVSHGGNSAFQQGAGEHIGLDFSRLVEGRIEGHLASVYFSWSKWSLNALRAKLV